MTTTSTPGDQANDGARAAEGASQPCSPRFAKEIDRLLLEESPSEKRIARLREHVAVCAACRQRYNKVALAGRLLHGGPAALQTPSGAELARARERLLGRTRLSPEPPAKRSALRFIFALAATGAAVAIAWPLVGGMQGEPAAPAVSTPEFQARGAPAKRGLQVGLRAICIRNKPGTDKPELRELPPEGQGRCGVGDALSFAYTNRTSSEGGSNKSSSSEGEGLGQMLLVGVDERYAIKWYMPREPSGTSFAVETNAVDEPLPRAVRLEVHHRPGKLRIFAIFSAKPVSGAALLAAVARAKQRLGGELSRLELIPLEDTEQRLMQLELTPAQPGDASVKALQLDGPGAQKPQEN